MNNKNRKLNKGFTIIEAMVAIFILTVSVSSMLVITASSAASARYSNNEIAANFLLQEAVDSIRNSRDTLAFQMKDTGGGWDNFLKRYGYQNSKCFAASGCDVIIEDFKPKDISGTDIIPCSSDGCQNLKYDDTATPIFYNHSDHGVDSQFKRTVKMEIVDDNQNQVKVTAKVEWLNGDNTNLRTQELVIYLLNWQK